MNSGIYAIGLFVLMASLYCLAYYLNAKTPKPKGCENLKSECQGCKVVGCANHPSHDLEGGQHHA